MGISREHHKFSVGAYCAGDLQKSESVNVRPLMWGHTSVKIKFYWALRGFIGIWERVLCKAIVTTQNKSGRHKEMSSIATQQIKSPIQLVDIVVLVMDLFDYVIEVANAYSTKTFIPIRICLSTPPIVSKCTRGLASTEQPSHLYR